MDYRIEILNKAGSAFIEIEGVIGVPEEDQFGRRDGRVSTYGSLKSSLDRIRAIDAEDVTVNIRSTGGSVREALLIYDALSSLGARITTICSGYVASAATVIAQAASPGRRQVSANSLYLIHRSSCAVEGDTGELERTRQLLDKTDERLADIYARRSGLPENGFRELMKENNGRGRWLSPQEVLEHGLADSIIGKETHVRAKEDAVNEINNLNENMQKQNLIKSIRRHWNAIWDLIAPVPGNDGIDTPSPTEGTVTTSDTETGADEKGRDSLGGLTCGVEACRSDVTEGPDNHLDIMEADRKRLSVRATATKPKEDPAVNEPVLSSNQRAYMEDLRNFIS